MNIVLLGGPGAGKGTLANQLQKKYGDYFLLSPGSLYRKEAQLGTEFGLKARDEYWGKGNLCPDEMTNQLVWQTIKGLCSPNVIFDGYPRTVTQAKYLDGIIQIDNILDIVISDKIAIQRLLRRSKIENRPDDTEAVIKQRLEVYHSNNSQIIEYYITSGRYFKVDGEGTPKDTLVLVEQILRR